MGFLLKSFILISVLLNSFFVMADGTLSLCELGLSDHSHLLPSELRHRDSFVSKNILDISFGLEELEAAIPSHSIDLVVALGSTFSNPRANDEKLIRALNEIYRVLRYKGVVVLSPVHADRLKTIFRLINQTAVNIFITQVTDIGNRSYFITFEKWDR